MILFRMTLCLSLICFCQSALCAQTDPRQYSGANGAAKIAKLPALSPARVMEAGILVREARLNPQNANDPRTVVVYLPQGAKGKIPVVMVASAGTPLLHGIRWDGGNPPEFMPYLRAGFAVVGYDVDGAYKDDNAPDDSKLRAAIRQFMNAEAGVRNATLALRYALAREKKLDEKRVFVAGHSSATTLALQIAAANASIRGAVAYAPCTNMYNRIGSSNINLISAGVSGFESFVNRVSPIQNTTSIKCPVFVFHAEDDSNIPISESREYVARLKQDRKKVTFVPVQSGGHYDSMVTAGVPAGIAWLKTQIK